MHKKSLGKHPIYAIEFYRSQKTIAYPLSKPTDYYMQAPISTINIHYQNQPIIICKHLLALIVVGFFIDYRGHAQCK